ncbi:MAG TPA: lipopolysaccharide heptosyltransferase II [Chthonomonadaceae bacterium]|nr:lipopolysaccharide heptosyltransferase II [Chthonomonadaceae bacterium]
MTGKVDNDPARWNGKEPGRAAEREATTLASGRVVEAVRSALAQAERVLVVTKFRFMGDTVVATPFLGQLRRHYPKAHITLLTAPSVVTALANCPHLDRMIPLETRGVGRWRHSRELYQLLRAGRYQAAFVLNRSLHCALMCALAGIPNRIGYANEFRRPFLTVPVPYLFDRNEVDCHLDMLRALGLPAEAALPELWITEAERQRAQAILAEHGWDGSRPLIGVQPGANDPHIREWGAERYARVADTLADELGGRVVLMGGAAERRTAERMAWAMQHQPLDLVGALELREALSVIGQCDLWLGNDTGLLHTAVSLRVASVGLFGPNKVVRWGYHAPRHRSLVVFPERPAQDDATVRRCLDAISEEQVLETARAVLRAPVTPVSERVGAAASVEPVLRRPPYFAATLNDAQLLPARRR